MGGREEAKGWAGDKPYSTQRRESGKERLCLQMSAMWESKRMGASEILPEGCLGWEKTPAETDHGDRLTSGALGNEIGRGKVDQHITGHRSEAPGPRLCTGPLPLELFPTTLLICLCQSRADRTNCTPRLSCGRPL